MKELQASGIRSGWRCTVCKRPSASKAKLLTQKCEGPAMDKLQKLVGRAAERAERLNDGHSRVYAEEVVWCSTCGSYADKKANGMGTVCKGAPARGRSHGGMWGQLHKLRRGRPSQDRRAT